MTIIEYYATKPGLKQVQIKLRKVFPHFPISSIPICNKITKIKGRLIYKILQSEDCMIACLNRLSWQKVRLIF